MKRGYIHHHPIPPTKAAKRPIARSPSISFPALQSQNKSKIYSTVERVGAVIALPPSKNCQNGLISSDGKTMKLVHYSMAALCLISLSGCGSKEEADKALKQYKSGACGHEVIQDHNALLNTCSFIVDANGVLNCEASRDSFLAKYPGISCEAVRVNAVSEDEKRFSITEPYVKAIVGLAVVGYYERSKPKSPASSPKKSTNKKISKSKK